MQKTDVSGLCATMNALALLLPQRSRPSLPGGPPDLGRAILQALKRTQHRDGGLRIVGRWLQGILPDQRQSLTRWFATLRRDTAVQLTAALAVRIRDMPSDGKAFEFIIALLHGLAAASRPRRRAARPGLAPPAAVFRALQHLPRTAAVRSSSHVDDLDDLLSRLIGIALDRFDFQEGSVLLLDESRNDLVFYRSVSPVAQRLLGVRVPLANSIAGTLLQTRQPAYVADVLQAGQHYGEVDKATGVRTESILGAPLLSRDRPFGVVELVNRNTPTPCSQSDLEEFMGFVDAAEAIVAEILRRRTVVDCFARSVRAMCSGRRGARFDDVAGMSRRWRLPHGARLPLEAAWAALGIAQCGEATQQIAAKLLGALDEFLQAQTGRSTIPFGTLSVDYGRNK